MANFHQKYRPQQFADIAGQDHIVAIISNSLKNNAVASAYLFTGPRGTGKTSTARLLARALVCQQPKEGEPCNKCDNCRSAIKGNLTDIIEMDAASHTSVENIRELIEGANFLPTAGAKKIYVIDEVHMLSKSAFNALLKTLEEPPEHLHFIFATTEPQKIPATILSRCQRFDFGRISAETITKVLTKICKAEKISADDESLALIARASTGSLRDAQVLLAQLASSGDLDASTVRQRLGLVEQVMIDRYLELIDSQDKNATLEHIAKVYDQYGNVNRFVDGILEALKERLLTTEGFDLTRTLETIDTIRQSVKRLKNAYLPTLGLETATVLLCHQSEPSTLTSKSKGDKLDSNKKTKQPTASESVDVADQWKTTLSKLEKPLQKDLQTVSIDRLTDTHLTLAVATQFFFDRLSRPEIRSQIEQAAQETFGDQLQVEIIIKKETKKSLSPTDVMDVFGGGEVV